MESESEEVQKKFVLTVKEAESRKKMLTLDNGSYFVGYNLHNPESYHKYLLCKIDSLHSHLVL